MTHEPSLAAYASARHFLGAELRCWRLHRGMTLNELAQAVYVSQDLIRKIEKAERTPTASVIRDCDTALTTGGALTRLLRYAEHLAARPTPVAPGSGASITIHINMDPFVEVPENPSLSPADGARVYQLSAVRERRHS